MIVELRRCRDGVESVLGSALLRPPISAARASCELAVAARDGHYEFSIAPAHAPAPALAPAPIEPSRAVDPAPACAQHSSPLPLNEPFSLDEPLPLGEPLSLGELDGTFLTSPLAGGFLGVWLGVFADQEHAGLDTPSPPVRVSGAAYAPTDGMLPHPRGAPRTGMPGPRY